MQPPSPSGLNQTDSEASSPEVILDLPPDLGRASPASAGLERSSAEVPSGGQPRPVPEAGSGPGVGCAGLLGLGLWFQPQSEQRCPPLGPVGSQEAPGPSPLELGDGSSLDTAPGR